MKKIRSKNLVFLMISIVAPWGFINTYYSLVGEILFISGYYANERNRCFKKEVLKINKKYIQKIGFCGDFEAESIEPELSGYYGKYKSQELCFILKDDKKIGWNVRFYTKKQLSKLFEQTDENSILGSELRKILKL